MTVCFTLTRSSCQSECTLRLIAAGADVGPASCAYTLCLHVTDQNSRGRLALLLALGRAMLLPLATAVLPRLTLIFFRYMQPLLIQRVSLFVAQPVTDFTTNQGWGLTGAYGLVYLGIAVSSHGRNSSLAIDSASSLRQYTITRSTV